jgi:hypothetical protein
MLSRRGTLFRLTAFLLLGCFFAFYLFLRSPPTLGEPGPEDDATIDIPTQYNDTTILPPLYPDLAQAEERLPQHNENLPYPEGRHAKLLRFGNEMWG